jgi:hypothetical protein
MHYCWQNTIDTSGPHGKCVVVHRDGPAWDAGTIHYDHNAYLNTDAAKNSYTCECPTGYQQKTAHFSHEASKYAEESTTGMESLRHICEATNFPTAAPTAYPTPGPTLAPTKTHVCDTGKHFCWVNSIDDGRIDGGACVLPADYSKTTTYTCECPIGYETTKAHFDGTGTESNTHTLLATGMWSEELLRHKCGITPAPTKNPTNTPTAPTPVPTQVPTSIPTTHYPSKAPSAAPTVPTATPTVPTNAPTGVPTYDIHMCHNGRYCTRWTNLWVYNNKKSLSFARQKKADGSWTEGAWVKYCETAELANAPKKTILVDGKWIQLPGKFGFGHKCWNNDTEEHHEYDAECVTPEDINARFQYTCECPAGHEQTVVHMTHFFTAQIAKGVTGMDYSAEEFEKEYRHACAATGKPSSSPTPAPTKIPTTAPTATHACTSGEHFCWKQTKASSDLLTAKTDLPVEDARCMAGPSGPYEYECECPEGTTALRVHITHYTELEGDMKALFLREYAHKCHVPTAAPTPAPTMYPTTYPTPAPTAHACDSGAHFCWKGLSHHGHCIKGFQQFDYTCECPVGYHRTHAHLRHDISDKTAALRHQCAAITKAPTHEPTRAPTAQPTEEPTVKPTSHPTNMPTTAAPTKLPTSAPTSVHVCDSGKHFCSRNDVSGKFIAGHCVKEFSDTEFEDINMQKYQVASHLAYQCYCPAGSVQTQVCGLIVNCSLLYPTHTCTHTLQVHVNHLVSESFPNTLSHLCSATLPPSTAPTSTPSAAPSSTPSYVPTAVPSIVPTAVPTELDTPLPGNTLAPSVAEGDAAANGPKTAEDEMP